MTIQELEAKYPDKYFGAVCVKRGWKYISNSGEDSLSGIEDLGWETSIYGSGDECEIGSMPITEELIENLKEAVAYCKANP